MNANLRRCVPVYVYNRTDVGLGPFDSFRIEVDVDMVSAEEIHARLAASDVARHADFNVTESGPRVEFEVLVHELQNIAWDVLVSMIATVLVAEAERWRRRDDED